MNGFCTDCTAPLGKLNKSGFCRSCGSKRRYADPVYKAQWQAKLTAKMEDPEFRAVRSQMMKDRYADPEARRKVSEAKKQSFRDNPEMAQAHRERAGQNFSQWHKDTDRDWSTWAKDQAAQRLARQFAWCPDDRREEYRRLVKGGMRAAEARGIIERDMAVQERRRLRELSPFERQMALLNSGSKLVEIHRKSKAEPAFTLGGVATGSL
jgi:hypothetical protein